MKRMCGILLSRLQLAATKIVKNPTTNTHARRIREDVVFYRDWLLPKFQLYCDQLGWAMPQVGAFDIGDDELKADGMDWIVNNIRPTEFVSRQYQSDYEVSYDAPPRPRAESTSSLISSSSIGSKSTFRKLKNIIRRSASQDDKIAAARTRAADLLRPQPFSESNVHRLNELKYAKSKTNELLREKNQHSSNALCSDVDDLKHRMVVPVSCVTGVALSVADITQLTSTSTRGYFHVAAVVLQAFCLWALLNRLFVYAFEEIDFGQKKFSTTAHAKKYCSSAVRKVSCMVAVSVAAISCCLGFVVGVVFREICTIFNDVQNLVNMSYCSMDISDDVIFFHINDVVSSLRRTWAVFTWFTLKMSCLVPGLTRALSFANAISNGPLRKCVSGPELEEPWTSMALDVSSFIALRLVVFCSALVIIGRLLFPKRK